MTKEQAKQLVKETLQDSFDRERFVHLVRNILNTIDDSKNFSYHGQFIPDAYKAHVRKYERVGKYEDPEGGKLDVLIVFLQKDTTLERARTAQRNFTAWYLKRRGEKDAALIAFVSPNEEEWRFSFVKMEYKLTDSASGKAGATEEFTPARRYSFLVGGNENSHTAQSRLVPLLVEDDQNPTLQELEDAFSIEKVTKEFFERYRDLFLRLKDDLDELVKSDEKIKGDFADKDIDTVNFAKKLLGQIVFLYFLQKKGWFGVRRRAEWGSGSRKFLRELFEGQHGKYGNFYNDILESLFYEALRQDRSHDDDYYSRFDCRIPFLNGGLFDPLNNYDWVNTDVLLPDDLFSNNVRTKSGDVGTGILDIFDRYNFTVKEDEPLEKEVAVDPEMLGKVFENLLEVKDRKSKGTYYTPREIVHYMCQESLAHYLATELEGKVSKEDIETLIKYGETVVEHDSRVVKEGRETEDYSFKLPKSVRNNASEIDEKLAAIRICDPAVGSGAFPVGMMNEIVRTRNALSNYVNGGKERSVYNFKRDAIQNSLYGVDIDPGAVEIAKLRLWLSLIVDEEDIRDIKPLPNLDYKIVQGNSLLSVQKNLFNQPLFNKLEDLKPKFFEETNSRKKQEYKKQIDELITQITNGRKDFDLEVYFSEVFHEKKGLDVVIANPPYVFTRGSGFTDSFKKFIRESYFSGKGKINLFSLFIEKASHILKEGGIYAYIIPNTFFRATSYKLAREYIVKRNRILQIIDLHSGIFEAVTSTTVLEAQNISASNNDIEIIDDFDQVLSGRASTRTISQSYFDNNEYIFSIYLTNESRKIFAKMHEDSVDLGSICSEIIEGIVTPKGKNLFISDEQKDQSYKHFLEGKDVGRYQVKWRGKYIRFDRSDLHRPRPDYLWESPNKILLRRIGGSNESIVATLDEDNFYTYASINNLLLDDKSEFDYRYILALLNSKLLNWYYTENFTNRSDLTVNISKTYLEKLPVHVTDVIGQKPLIDLVEKILTITSDDGYLENQVKQNTVRKVEKKIDRLVYKLYGLTPEEIKIVEVNTK